MFENDLTQCAAVDVKTVRKEELVDIGNVYIDVNKPVMERVVDFVSQVKNPYCYVDHGIIVKISFTGKKKLEDCIKQCAFF